MAADWHWFMPGKQFQTEQTTTLEWGHFHNLVGVKVHWRLSAWVTLEGFGGFEPKSLWG
jgi:hypothetical protein